MEHQKNEKALENNNLRLSQLNCSLNFTRP